jgi:hypothetical protein
VPAQIVVQVNSGILRNAGRAKSGAGGATIKAFVPVPTVLVPGFFEAHQRPTRTPAHPQQHPTNATTTIATV